MALLQSNLSSSTSPKILRDDAHEERPVDSCQFLFTVISATGLCDMTAWSQGQGGYVTIAISGRQIYKTAVVGNAREPEWNDTFQFTAKRSDSLVVSVYASNVSRHDILLGLIEESLLNADCRGNDMSRKVSKTQGSGSFVLNFRFERAMFGLFIAIDEYEIQAIPKLRGCKTDARSMMEILARRFHVPTANFLFLADEQATRSAIISGFQKHLIENRNIHHGDAIVVFYAGHGSQTDAPDGWIADKGKVETICPHDERSMGKDGKEIFGIPDRTIGGLLRSLATAKGDNITVIFDSCHSGGISRGMMARTVPNTSRLPNDLDKDIWMGGMPSTTAAGFLDQTMWSHVLLAACGDNELALEGTSTEEIVRGVFTQALVTFLDRELDTTNLTYASLLNRLPPLERQHPQCSGKNRTRALFGGLVGHPMTFGLSYHDGKYRAEAGEIHGVVKGTQFTIHTLANDTTTNSESVIFEADLIFAHSCILSRRNVDGIKFEIPPGARVWVSNWRQRDKALKVFMESPHDGVQSIEDVFFLVDSSESADLMIRRTDEGTLQFERLDPLMSKYAPVLCNIASEPSLSEILQGVSRFNFHISRCNSKEPLQPHVKVILHRLTQSNPDQVLEQTIYAPDGHIDITLVTERENTVFASSEAAADVNGPFYGLTVTNESGRDLFPYLFYFDPSNYSIQPLYHPPCSTMEAPLAPVHATNRSSKLKVGHGEANVEALQFSLTDEMTEDVGFLKLFVSSTYVDMTGLEQESLLHGARGRGFKMVRPPPEGLWDTWTYVIKTVETGS